MGFGDLFDSPWKILIIAVVIIVLFGSAKLPKAARSLGQSMRILKREVQGLHEDDDAEPAAAKAQPELAAGAPAATAAQVQAGAPAAAAAQVQPGAPVQADQQAQIEALQQQVRDMQRAAAMGNPTVNAGASAQPPPHQPS
ncbi:MAG: Sec-independent protein translocase subunit TatA [Streptosporangiaceae bacterium]|nr:Sec-independent protein translocase subunit TatA [Streptosporangiaceae bacterium]